MNKPSYLIPHTSYSSHRAFTILEILITLAIALILLGVSVTTLLNYRTSRELDTITDTIASKLEEARSNAMSGKNGTNFGLAFSTSTYIYWSGSSYFQGAVENTIYPISSNLSITSTISGTDHAVMFARITGLPNVTGTTTITNNFNASTSDSIYIGPNGEITVVK